MLSSIFFATVLAAVAVQADPNPSEPGPGSSYNEGSTCHIAWEADTTGAWKTMNIELMSGSNLGMNHITTVVTVDGTNAANATYDYPCPEVTPNSAIYFYQFTSPSSSATYWTTRFTIADSNGKSTPPANANQPNGDAIPWGTGDLVDPSLATPAPAKGTNSTSSSTSASSSASSVPGASSSSSSSGSSVVVPSSSAPLSSSSSASVRTGSSSSMVSVPTSSASTNTTTSNSTGAAASGAVAVSFDSRLTQAAATLGLVAAAFAVIL